MLIHHQKFIDTHKCLSWVYYGNKLAVFYWTVAVHILGRYNHRVRKKKKKNITSGEPMRMMMALSLWQMGAGWPKLLLHQQGKSCASFFFLIFFRHCISARGRGTCCVYFIISRVTITIRQQREREKIRKKKVHCLKGLYRMHPNTKKELGKKKKRHRKKSSQRGMRTAGPLIDFHERYKYVLDWSENAIKLSVCYYLMSSSAGQTKK